MPKDKRGYSHSSNRSRTSPYPCSSGHAVHPLSKKSLDSAEDVKEWEEARCPVCMEHPHNAVLLLCSSHGKGCRPYMCDTSQRHSNCLDQFRKAFAETPKSPIQDGTFQSSMVTMGPTHMTVQGSRAEVLPSQIHSPDDKTQIKLVCPLCRGQVNGWIVVEPARRFMNAKSRNCACETCDFSGTYSNLRKHARVEHPLVRPSEADPERQRDWSRMEQETDMGDFFSAIESTFAENPEGIESAFAEEDMDEDARRTSLSLYFILRVYRLPPSESGASSWPRSRSRSSVHLRRQRRTSPVTLQGEDLDTETDFDALEDDSFEVPSSPLYSPSHQWNQRRSQLPTFESGARSPYTSRAHLRRNRTSPPSVTEEDPDTETVFNAVEDGSFEDATNPQYSPIHQQNQRHSQAPTSEAGASIWARSPYTSGVHLRRSRTSRQPVTPENIDLETVLNAVEDNSFEVATSPGYNPSYQQNRRRSHVPTSESGGSRWTRSPYTSRVHLGRSRTSRPPVPGNIDIETVSNAMEDDSFEVMTSSGYSPSHQQNQRRYQVPTSESRASSWGRSPYTSRIHLRSRTSRSPVTPENIDIETVFNAVEGDSFEVATSPGYSPIHQQNQGRSRVPISEFGASSWPRSTYTSRVHLRSRTSRLPVTPENIDTDTMFNALEDDSFEVATSPGYSPVRQPNQRRRRDQP